MMHFGNSVVVPTYYAMFTIASVAAVALVYREFDCMELGPGTAFVFGVVLTVIGPLPNPRTPSPKQETRNPAFISSIVRTIFGCWRMH
jgi:hypothetical protein